MRKIGVALVAAALLALVVWSFRGFFASPPAGTKIVVYEFSIMSEPLQERIFPAFREKWKRETGEDVAFEDSPNASGTVANQVAGGAPAAVAILSHPGDADRIVASGVTKSDWRALPHGGIVNRSAVVIACRPGNPRKIKSFADLGAAGTRVVHPDPLTSGGANWAVMAEYAAPLVDARREGRAPDEAAAEAQLLALWKNVVAQAPSARAAKTQFDSGFGDALVTYEVEELLEGRRGRESELVLPETTLLTEHPVVVVDRNINESDRRAVDAFVQFLWSDEAQRAFVEFGYRSVLPGLDASNPKLKPVPHLFTVGDLGGWAKAKNDIVEKIWKGRVLPQMKN